MRASEYRTTIEIHAPPELVFDRLSDHESMAQWPGVSACRLVREGKPRNGVGAIRAVTALGVTLHEEVVRFEAPRRFEYRIIRGLPVDHLGTVTVEEIPSGSRVSWHIRLSSRVPLLSTVVLTLLGRGLPKALAFVKQELDSAREEKRS
jgi:uncharacterized protein YndB with AHSA1/START domain